jgi:hypothetical protein
MTDSKKNNKKKQPRLTSKRIEAGRLKQLLNELHEDEAKDIRSRQRAEDILNLIRSRQAEQERKEAIKHWISFVEHIEKVASQKAIDFLNKTIRK